MLAESLLNALMEISVLSFILPMVVLLTWRLRSRKNLMPALWGALIYLFFVKLLEVIPYAFFVGYDNPISRIVRTNDITFAVYKGVIAALFEETGRYIILYFLLKKEKYNNRQTAITYGIGHGGMECFILVGINNLQYYISALLINTKLSKGKLPSEFDPYLKDLQKMNWVTSTLDAVYFALMFVIQIGLSIIIYQAVRNNVLRLRLICYAAFLHFLSYIPAGVCHQGLISPVWSVLFQIVVMVATLFISCGIYKEMGKREKEQDSEKRSQARKDGKDIWSVSRKKLSNLNEEDK